MSWVKEVEEGDKEEEKEEEDKEKEEEKECSSWPEYKAIYNLTQVSPPILSRFSLGFIFFGSNRLNLLCLLCRSGFVSM